MITARGLRKSHRSEAAEWPVLHDVDLDVAHDEFVAVMGPSGCGKSTLLRILGGLDRPDRGSVSIGGVAIDGLDEERRAAFRRGDVGFVFQQFHLVPSLSVVANVALTSIVSGARKRDWKPRAEHLLGSLGLSDLAGRTPASLSGGEQQRIAVARAVFHEPSVLLADEPTGSLDTTNGRRVVDLIASSRFSTVTRAVVLVTHDVEVAASADRVVLMRDGALVDDIDLAMMEGTDRAEHIRRRLGVPRP